MTVKRKHKKARASKSTCYEDCKLQTTCEMHAVVSDININASYKYLLYFYFHFRCWQISSTLNLTIFSIISLLTLFSVFHDYNTSQKHEQLPFSLKRSLKINVAWYTFSVLPRNTPPSNLYFAKQYKGPPTAVQFISMTVLPNFPCLYRGFLCV